jgi:adenosine deaminase
MVAVPVAEMHVHLEGTLRPAVVARLAARNGRAAALPQMDWVRPRHRWAEPREWLRTMRRVGDACLRTPDDYAEAMADYAQRLAEQGGVYAEISVALSRAGRGGRDDMAILGAVCEAAAEAPLPVRVLVALDQGTPAEEAEAQLRRAVARRSEMLVGIDLHGAPVQPLAAFARLFALAGAEGLGRRAHAGEVEGPRSVAEAIALGVERIAHGVRAVEDEVVLQRVADAGLVLDVCPGSNLALGLYAEVADHPLPRLLAAGIPVTLGSDDPLYFNTSARGEYECAAEMGLSGDDLLAVTLTAVAASFAAPALRCSLVARLKQAQEAGFEG